jgi:hypothetical protein
MIGRRIVLIENWVAENMRRNAEGKGWDKIRKFECGKLGGREDARRGK